MAADRTDVAIVGAGAAGLMAAIQAARAGARTVLLDSRKKIGAKILISGGTRCNVTNVKVDARDYEGGPRHFIKHVLEAFTPDRTIRFFKDIGVDLVLEPTGKYFPTTHSGKTVLEALMREAERCCVQVRTGCRVTDAAFSDGRFRIGVSSEQGRLPVLEARQLILATGGLSYPETGSDGSGYALARDLGHTIVATSAALTPLISQDPFWNALSGVTLDVTLSFYASARKRKEVTGSLLFTHNGFSGPAALDISRHMARAEASEAPRLEIDFLPGQSEEDCIRIWERGTKDTPRKGVLRFCIERFGLPERVSAALVAKAGVEPEFPMGRLGDPKRRSLVRALKHQSAGVTGVIGYKKAEATAGGVDLAEVHAATMGSKKIKGLYFAGEILDVDGRIGGFNFQWAWSSGALAGMSAAKAARA